jgi:hypothetical protein
MLTPLLVYARLTIINCVSFSLAPVEFVFDLIEDELKRRGVELSQLEPEKPKQGR